MKNEVEKEGGLEEAKDLLKDGLVKIFKATGKISKEIIKGFKEGYTEENKKE